MPLADFEQTVEAFWRRRQEGIFFPQEWEGMLTIDDACRIQLALLDRYVAQGARQVGWKVGLTSKAMQEQFRVHEPLFGYLMDSAPSDSGTSFDYASLINPAFENEICMTLGTNLIGPGVDAQVALASVVSVMPAMELVETRGPFTEQLALAITDNIQQRGIILGPETSPLPSGLDLQAVSVGVSVNGTLVAEGTGDAVLGHPINSLVWLANKLAEYERGLRAGDVVMSGSLTRQFSISRGDTIMAAFDPLGKVGASFI
jgi:2-keto-4-pentenoate hydratase